MEQEDESSTADQIWGLKSELRKKMTTRPSPAPRGSSKSTHLGRVKLPEFDGKFKHWPMFKQE